MRDRPAGVSDREVTQVLADGWKIEAVSTRYAAVGGGGYHWVVRDGQGGQWFVTVGDLDDMPWLGDTPAAVSKALRAAMDTSLALRHHAGLSFVVAPVPALSGETVLPMGSRYAVTVFSFVDGASGRFGESPSAGERTRLVDMLAALHSSTAATSRVSVCEIGVPGRDGLETALRELGQPWHGGPFSEPARAMIARNAGQITELLGTFDRLARSVTRLPPVITHGEPHPGNLIRNGDETMLIDWDTVGLAPPERDLWMVVSDGGEESRRYTRATGRPVDPDALKLYRIRWALDDLSYFVRRFRAEHGRTAETERAWQAMGNTRAPDWLRRINAGGS